MTIFCESWAAVEWKMKVEVIRKCTWHEMMPFGISVFAGLRLQRFPVSGRMVAGMWCKGSPWGGFMGQNVILQQNEQWIRPMNIHIWCGLHYSIFYIILSQYSNMSWHYVFKMTQFRCIQTLFVCKIIMRIWLQYYQSVLQYRVAWRLQLSNFLNRPLIKHHNRSLDSKTLLALTGVTWGCWSRSIFDEARACVH